MKSTNVNSLVLAAAFAGILGGTSARLNAQPVSGHSGSDRKLLRICWCHGRGR